jgi:transposase
LVAFHSSKRARKDEYDRQDDLERIEKYLSSTAKSQLTSRLKKPYVTVSKACKIEIDSEKLEQAKQFDGFFGIQTNQKELNPDKELNAKELLGTYRGLWQIEQTFRISKSNLEIRPVFHYSTKRIKAHFLICHMALALIRYVEFKLKQNHLNYPVEQLNMILNRVRVAHLQHTDNQVYTLLEDPPPEIAEIYPVLGLEVHRKFSARPAFVVP